MKIHPLNYEAYAMDYLEGKLSGMELESFERFLKDHPEVAAELEAMQLMYVQAEPEIIFEPKSSLKKPVGSGRVVALPFWAVAASWALVLGSFALWWYSSSSVEPHSTFAESVIEAAPQIEHQVEVAQHLPEVSKQKGTDSEIVSNTWSASTNVNWTALVYEDPNAVEEERLDDNQDLPAVAFLPPAKLQAELYSNQSQIIYYRPWRGFDPQAKQNTSLDQIAIMDPLKRISPKRYLRIRDFDFVDKLVKEIDEDQIANAFTPGILK